MFNKITIIGNLGSDPELRYTTNGDAVTSFSVATNRSYTTRDGESRQETEWFRVNVWGRSAEACNQYLEKGRLVYVEGGLSSRTWQGQDGETRFSNEIRSSEVKFLSGGPQADGEASDAAPAAATTAAAAAPAAPAGDTPKDLPW